MGSCAASSTAPVTSLSLDHIDAVVPESNVSALFPGFKVNATPCRSKTSLRTKYNRRREERIIAKEEDSSVVSMKEDDEKEDDEKEDDEEEEETRIEELKESKVDEVETVKDCVDVSTLVSGVTKEMEGGNSIFWKKIEKKLM